MRIKFINSIKGQTFYGFIVLITAFAGFSAKAAAGNQEIACVHRSGGQKHIYIEYSKANNKACRTVYNSGGNKSKAIAWAQSDTTICTEVANRVASRLGSSGWTCTTGAFTNVQLKTHPQKRKRVAHVIDSDPAQNRVSRTRLRKGHPINGDYVDTEWMEKGILK